MPSPRLGRVALIAALLPALAAADPFDFVVSNLGNPNALGNGFDARADSNFRVFVRELASAATAISLAPPETLGHSGFAFSTELAVVSFSGETQLQRAAPAFKGALLLPSLHLRKGLPFSFELGTRIGWIEKSRMGMATVELKWALNEGFAFSPDIGVRGHVTRLINSRDFDLTAGGVELAIGKQFPLGGMLTLTPYAGWDLVFVGATTRVMDFRPTRTLAEGDSGPEQFKDFDVYKPVVASANSHSRLSAGLRLIAGPMLVGFEVSYAVVPSFKDATSGEERSIPSALALAGTLGVDF